MISTSFDYEKPQTLEAALSLLVEHGGKGSIEGAIIARKIFEFVLQNELIQ